MGLDGEDALGIRQAEFAGEMACAIEPLGLGRDGDGAFFDAAVSLVHLVVACQPVGRSIGELVFDLPPDGGLVGLDREEIIAPATEDGLPGLFGLVNEAHYAPRQLRGGRNAPSTWEELPSAAPH